MSRSRTDPSSARRAHHTAAPPSRPSVTFEFLCGEIKAITFYKSPKPLGLAFDSRPLVVSRSIPDTQAEQQGVQPGWELVSVAGRPVKGMDAKYVMGLLGRFVRGPILENYMRIIGLECS